MAHVGIFLSSEEHSAPALVDLARKAEEAGFESAWISDHFHPWTHAQGESPFVWATLGGIAAATQRLRVHTAVTCPTVRMHPAIVAHAAATVATMFGPGRFGLGVGTGEALNEHILGDPWPSVDTRLAMLEEAVAIIRELWAGDVVTHDGDFYAVDRARLFSLPEEPPPIHVSAFGPKATEVAARIGDGFMAVGPAREGVEGYREHGGTGTTHTGYKVCWGTDEVQARKLAHELWPNEALAGEVAQLLPMPSNYEEAAALVTEDHIAEEVACGPDVDLHVEKLREHLDAGFDEVYVQQIGPDQDAFLRFYRDEVLPRV